MMKTVAICVLAGLMLSGCYKSNPAQTKVHTPYGTVKYKCPPGQAKKGNCVSHHVPGKHHKY